jgi:hypothetical protein
MNRRGFFGLLAALPFVGWFKKPRFSIRLNRGEELVRLYGPKLYEQKCVRCKWVKNETGAMLLPGRLVHYKHAKS